jgi:transcription initiation factor TFIID TATA-box-binding protein
MNPRITNVVTRANLHCKLNLRNIVSKVMNVIYNPKKYSGLIWHHRHIKSKCFVFHTGIILCMGNNTLKDAKKDIRKYGRLLCKLGYNVHIIQIKLVTQSAVATLSGKLHINRGFSFPKRNI